MSSAAAAMPYPTLCALLSTFQGAAQCSSSLAQWQLHPLGGLFMVSMLGTFCLWEALPEPGDNN